MKQILTVVGVVFVSLGMWGAGRANAYEEYIDRYSGMAVEQMHAYGIPASITLAQGLLESGAGRSTLAREGNNHFGIKCHADWKGDTMLRDDDAPDECFRVYRTPDESFKDHSLFLRRKRYAPLFDLNPTDYAGWARGLKKCGYATDPQYAERLISIIELYGLYNFDNGHIKTLEEIAGFISGELMSRHAIRRSRGLHYVISRPGDTYGKIAKELKIDRKKLLKYNDVSADGEIRPWQEVYLQEKLDEAPAGVAKATIGADESMHSLAQRFGMRLERLQELNPGVKDAPGSVLRLR